MEALRYICTHMPYEIFCSTKVLWLPVFHLHIGKTFAGFISPALKLLEISLIIIQTFAKKNLRFIKIHKKPQRFCTMEDLLLTAYPHTNYC